MPKVGDLVKGKVTKILDNGAWINLIPRSEGSAFLPIREISLNKYVRSGSVDRFVKLGEERSFRIVEISQTRDGRTRITVSMKRVDENKFNAVNFERKMKDFMDSSKEIQHQIRKNTDRKQGTLKKKTNKKEN